MNANIESSENGEKGNNTIWYVILHIPVSKNQHCASRMSSPAMGNQVAKACQGERLR
jgi:hypothetical protein